MAHRKLRVMVIDPLPLFRRGTASAIDDHPDMEAVMAEADAEDPVDEIRREAPDIVIADAEYTDRRGHQLAHALRDNLARVRLILLAAPNGRSSVSEALGSGVSGFISKASDAQAIRGTILAVARGDTVISERDRSRLLAEIDPDEHPPPTKISPREHQVLLLAAEGKTAAAIGLELHVSEATVRTHLRRTYDKLGVANKTAAVVEATRLGLIQ